MKQQPDKIFSDLLRDARMPAPPMAWEKIEAGLDKKKHGFAWLYVAASVTLVALSATAFYFNSNETETIAVKTVISKPDVDQEKNSAPEVKSESAIKSNNKVQIEEKKGNKEEEVRRPSIRKPLQELPPVITDEATQVAIAESETVVVPDSSVEQYKEPVNLAFRASTPEEKKERVTIVLSTKDTDEYLIVKNSNTEATSDEEKSSTLKKLLKKAADLKVNQDPFGDLRQKKNEILALNFRSDNQRGQKK